MEYVSVYPGEDVWRHGSIKIATLWKSTEKGTLINRREFGKHIWLFCQKLSCDIIKKALLFLENYCAKATWQTREQKCKYEQDWKMCIVILQMWRMLQTIYLFIIRLNKLRSSRTVKYYVTVIKKTVYTPWSYRDL